jgi:mRNA-degrading endonuclease RelE of RelBE toxin-antitoxin system
MKVFQTPTFQRKYKKLNRNQLSLVNDAIESIIAEPEIGELKRGDLGSIRVHKVRKTKVEVLVAYWSTETSIQLIDFGSHENFYRDLKRQLF